LSVPGNRTTAIRAATRSGTRERRPPVTGGGGRPAGPTRRSRLRRIACPAPYPARCDQAKAHSIRGVPRGTIKTSGGGPLAPRKNQSRATAGPKFGPSGGPKGHRTTGRRHRASPRDVGAGRDGRPMSVSSTDREAARSDCTRPRPVLLAKPSPKGTTSVTGSPVTGVTDLAAWRRHGRYLQLTSSVAAPCTGVCTCWGAPLGGWSA
jgi:hypothetical protein